MPYSEKFHHNLRHDIYRNNCNYIDALSTQHIMWYKDYSKWL